MHIAVPHERLVASIKQYGSEGLEAKQVASRLRDLLHTRFRALRDEYFYTLNSSARAERNALIDARYADHVEEYLQVMGNARSARVQYETHLMLLQARQTLRRLQSR